MFSFLYEFEDQVRGRKMGSLKSETFAAGASAPWNERLRSAYSDPRQSGTFWACSPEQRMKDIAQTVWLVITNATVHEIGYRDYKYKRMGWS